MNANNNEYILVTKIMIVLLPYLTSIVVTNKYTELRTNIRSIAVLKLTEAKPICTFFRARLHADAVCFFSSEQRCSSHTSLSWEFNIEDDHRYWEAEY